MRKYTDGTTLNAKADELYRWHDAVTPAQKEPFWKRASNAMHTAFEKLHERKMERDRVQAERQAERAREKSAKEWAKKDFSGVEFAGKEKAADPDAARRADAAKAAQEKAAQEKSAQEKCAATQARAAAQKPAHVKEIDFSGVEFAGKEPTWEEVSAREATKGRLQQLDERVRSRVTQAQAQRVIPQHVAKNAAVAEIVAQREKAATISQDKNPAQKPESQLAQAVIRSNPALAALQSLKAQSDARAASGWKSEIHGQAAINREMRQEKMAQGAIEAHAHPTVAEQTRQSDDRTRFAEDKEAQAEQDMWHKDHSQAPRARDEKEDVMEMDDLEKGVNEK